MCCRKEMGKILGGSGRALLLFLPVGSPLPVRRGALASSSNAPKTLVKDDPSASPQTYCKKYSKFLLHVYSLSCIIITIQFKTIYEEGLFYLDSTRNSHLLKMNRIV